MIESLLIALIIFSVLTSALFWKLMGIGAYAALFVVSPLVRVYSLLLVALFFVSIFCNF